MLELILSFLRCLRKRKSVGWPRHGGVPRRWPRDERILLAPATRSILATTSTWHNCLRRPNQSGHCSHPCPLLILCIMLLEARKWEHQEEQIGCLMVRVLLIHNSRSGLVNRMGYCTGRADYRISCFGCADELNHKLWWLFWIKGIVYVIFPLPRSIRLKKLWHQ